MKPQPHNQLSLYSPRGQRLYLDEAERGRFLKALEQADERTRLLGLVLFYTGCRLSEALELTPEHIRVVEGVTVFRTLKRRRRMIMREVPIPKTIIGPPLKKLQAASGLRIWPWHRVTAWRVIKAVMLDAEVRGMQASAKGLRHGFGVHAIRSGIQLNLLQKWMGHAQLSTTAIYANVIGAEEWYIASRMWANAYATDAFNPHWTRKR